MRSRGSATLHAQKPAARGRARRRSPGRRGRARRAGRAACRRRERQPALAARDLADEVPLPQHVRMVVRPVDRARPQDGSRSAPAQRRLHRHVVVPRAVPPGDGAARRGASSASGSGARGSVGGRAVVDAGVGAVAVDVDRARHDELPRSRTSARALDLTGLGVARAAGERVDDRVGARLLGRAAWREQRRTVAVEVLERLPARAARARRCGRARRHVRRRAGAARRSGRPGPVPPTKRTRIGLTVAQPFSCMSSSVADANGMRARARGSIRGTAAVRQGAVRRMPKEATMSTAGRRTLAAAIGLAAVLIAPSVANATIFSVSRDVTIYATRTGASPPQYPPGSRVDVRCYARGRRSTATPSGTGSGTGTTASPMCTTSTSRCRTAAAPPTTGSNRATAESRCRRSGPARAGSVRCRATSPSGWTSSQTSRTRR